MPTIVVHGTMTHEPAHAYDWWWKSYDGQGFLAGLTQGIGEAGGLDDIWKVGGTDVSRHPELQGGRRSFSTRDGRFLWSGGNQGGLRRVAGEQLARYLNVVAQLSPRAPIRVIAHSHGCNVVKRASASTRLSPQVFIPQAVFLACPHVVSSSSFGSKYPYRLNPERFGRILGLSSPRDSVQNVLAARFPSLWGGRLSRGLGASHLRCGPGSGCTAPLRGPRHPNARHRQGGTQRSPWQRRRVSRRAMAVRRRLRVDRTALLPSPARAGG